jgi:hypothetical protein
VAIAIVQNLTTFQTVSNNIAVATSATVAGNQLIAVLGVNDLNTNITGPSGWVKDAATDNIGAGCSCSVWSWLTPGGETLFSWTYSAGKNAYILFFEVSGLSVIAPNIRDRQHSQAPTTNTLIALTELAANQLPDEFAVAGVSLPNTGGAFVSMTAGWTNDTGANGINAAQLVYAGHKIVAAVETSANTITWTTSRVPAGCIVTYKGTSLDIVLPLITPT